MISYVLKRLMNLMVVALGVSLLTFSLGFFAPGDAAEIKLKQTGIEPSAQLVAKVREEMGLNKPIYQQYLHWLGNALRGDLGISFRSGTPVAREMLVKLPATVQLTGTSLLVLIGIAFPMGILAAVYKGTWVDHLSRAAALVGASLPSFWFSLLLIYFFAVKWSLLPVMGRGTLLHLVLPSLALGLGMASTYARFLRASILEVLGQEFIMAARARGLRERLVIVKDVLKNALLSIVTLLGMSIGHLLGGAVIVETIFAWPGVGKYAVDAIFFRDYPVIQGYVLWMALIFVVANLLVDISYHYIDPRIRLRRGSSH
ncbi:nickel ABC transporter permease [Candidatus Formimonas warabiya]|uniref:Nickel import system permease protein NikB n=1 Tax=Formimonas warabiya TaxID=1761012 RepID=A0A3G1KYZ8_FORW1|nr:nickel ABC transporter permease [Candidatus Formimonas warabiya]ATW27600.1 nickel ABC transporter permease subunit NikB [Candidatus Formimonas warabiya]